MLERESLPFAGGTPPGLHAGRCLNRRHAGAQCTRCVESCPVQAIALHGQMPQLDERACLRCGLCLQCCPADCFTPAAAYEQRLCQTLAQLPEEPTALVCAAHPTPALTPAVFSAVVQHRRCLAALSPAHLIELSHGGRRTLCLDDSPCAACAIGAAQTAMRHAVDTARNLLDAAGRPPSVLLYSECAPADVTRRHRRPVLDGAQPAMSRRAFLARLRPGQSCAAGDNPIKDWLERGVPVPARLPQQVPASRRHLLEVLRAMGIEKTATVSTGRTPFGSVNADSVCCSACALCARFCPTGALRFDDHADEYTLSFQPAACLNCGICVAVCPEGAVSLDATVHLADVIQDVASPLATGKLTTCPDCGAVISPLAGESDSRCHICRQGAGVVTSLRDGPGLMADLLKRVAPHSDLPS